MKRTKTRYVRIPYFPTLADLKRAERRKATLESQGFELIYSTACLLTYQLTLEY